MDLFLVPFTLSRVSHCGAATLFVGFSKLSVGTKFAWTPPFTVSVSIRKWDALGLSFQRRLESSGHRYVLRIHSGKQKEFDTVYFGVTNNPMKRANEHRNDLVEGCEERSRTGGEIEGVEATVEVEID